jgi:D-3-phosphoglycerate dehydrogenase
MKIVVLEPIGIDDDKKKFFEKKIDKMGHEIVFFDDRTEDDDVLIERCEGADVVILTNLPFRKNVINSCPNLKMISVAFTGVDHVDMDLCDEKGIVVCNAQGYSTNAVAELTIGLMISVMRKIVEGDRNTRELSTRKGFLGSELSGKTVGIIGTGEIGLTIAKVLKIFGCKLIAYSRSMKKEAINLGIKYVDLETLMSKSDIISLHTPLNSETELMINEKLISLMKSASVMINTSRGKVIDNEALGKALKEGRIGGAGIDVYDMEPPLPKDYPFIDAPNTVLVPHIGYATKEAIAERADIVFDNIKCWIEGNPKNVMTRG